jgi:hypothetical protein
MLLVRRGPWEQTFFCRTSGGWQARHLATVTATAKSVIARHRRTFRSPRRHRRLTRDRAQLTLSSRVGESRPGIHNDRSRCRSAMERIRAKTHFANAFKSEAVEWSLQQPDHVARMRLLALQHEATAAHHIQPSLSAQADDPVRRGVCERQGRCHTLDSSFRSAEREPGMTTRGMGAHHPPACRYSSSVPPPIPIRRAIVS